MTFEVV